MSANIVQFNEVSQVINAIDPSDPNFNYTDWENFNGHDWYANRVDCHGFGEITVITNFSNKCLKLFILKEISEILDYERPEKLSRLLTVDKDPDLGVLKSSSEINDLADRPAFSRAHVFNVSHLSNIRQLTDNITLPPRGLTLINYAGFNQSLMRSTKPNARLIQQWIYGSVMPSLAETGRYDPTNPMTLVAMLEDQQRLLTEVLNRLSEQSHEIAQLKSIIHNTSRFSAPNKMYTIADLCDYINIYYARPGQRIKPKSMFDYLCTESGLLKSNGKPYAKHINSRSIRMTSPFIANIPYHLEFSRTGMDMVADTLRINGHI